MNSCPRIEEACRNGSCCTLQRQKYKRILPLSKKYSSIQYFFLFGKYRAHIFFVTKTFWTPFDALMLASMPFLLTSLS